MQSQWSFICNFHKIIKKTFLRVRKNLTILSKVLFDTMKLPRTRVSPQPNRLSKRLHSKLPFDSFWHFVARKSPSKMSQRCWRVGSQEHLINLLNKLQWVAFCYVIHNGTSVLNFTRYFRSKIFQCSDISCSYSAFRCRHVYHLYNRDTSVIRKLWCLYLQRDI